MGPQRALRQPACPLHPRRLLRGCPENPARRPRPRAGFVDDYPRTEFHPEGSLRQQRHHQRIQEQKLQIRQALLRKERKRGCGKSPMVRIRQRHRPRILIFTCRRQQCEQQLLHHRNAGLRTQFRQKRSQTLPSLICRQMEKQRQGQCLFLHRFYSACRLRLRPPLPAGPCGNLLRKRLP